MADCPHHGFKDAASNWAAAWPPISPPTYKQIAIGRPIHCAECALARVKKLRDALMSAISIAAALLHANDNTPANRADAEKRLEKDIAAYYSDLRDWAGP